MLLKKGEHPYGVAVSMPAPDQYYPLQIEDLWSHWGDLTLSHVCFHNDMHMPCDTYTTFTQTDLSCSRVPLFSSYPDLTLTPSLDPLPLLSRSLTHAHTHSLFSTLTLTENIGHSFFCPCLAIDSPAHTHLRFILQNPFSVRDFTFTCIHLLKL